MSRRAAFLIVIIIVVLASYLFVWQSGGKAVVAAAVTEPEKWVYAQMAYVSANHSAVVAVADRDAMERINSDLGDIYEQFERQPFAVNYLDKMGSLGWELVSVNTTANGDVYTFKRSAGSF